MPDAAPLDPAAPRHGLTVAAHFSRFATEIDHEGRRRGQVERDISLKVRTYWHTTADLQPVDWVCKLLEHLQLSNESIWTVQEPPSDAFVHAFLNEPWGRPEECPIIHTDGSVGVPVLDGRRPGLAFRGRYYDRALDPSFATDEIDDLLLDGWGTGPTVQVDEHLQTRLVDSFHTSRVWLVGGAWTAEDAAAIEEYAIDSFGPPFTVFGPDGQVRPEHPWDRHGDLA